jgi:hypothetical protein
MDEYSQVKKILKTHNLQLRNFGEGDWIETNDSLKERLFGGQRVGVYYFGRHLVMCVPELRECTTVLKLTFCGTGLEVFGPGEFSVLQLRFGADGSMEGYGVSSETWHLSKQNIKR